jgi:hypothetical protein
VVAAHDSVRLDDGEGLGPAAPTAAQQDPEDPIGGSDVGLSSSGQGDELLAEGQVLDHEVASRTLGRAERRQKGHEKAKHRVGEKPGPCPNRQWFHCGRGFGEGQGTWLGISPLSAIPALVTGEITIMEARTNTYSNSCKGFPFGPLSTSSLLP